LKVLLPCRLKGGDGELLTSPLVPSLEQAMVIVLWTVVPIGTVPKL
jgi:hypothetical protein